MALKSILTGLEVASCLRCIIFAGLYTMDGIMLKVGQEEFKFTEKSLENIPDSYLSKVHSEGTESKLMSFPRCRESFRAIHEFCFTGKLHIPKNICVGKFKEELAFWGIDDSSVEECCLRKIYNYNSQQKSLVNFKSDFDETCKPAKEENTNGLTLQSIRTRVWEILDYRKDDLYEQIYLVVSICIVLASCVMIAVSTLPEIRSTLILNSGGKNKTEDQLPDQDPAPARNCKEHIESLNNTESQLLDCQTKFCNLCEDVERNFFHTDNSSWQMNVRQKCEICGLRIKPNIMDIAAISKIANLPTKAKNSLQLFVFEIIVMMFFTAEFLLRLASCPNLKRYFRSVLNTVDALSLCASYIRYGIFLFEIDIAETKFEFILYLQMFRILRLLRSLNKLVAFRVLRYSVRNGQKDLALIFLYMFVGMLLFSNFIYFFESNSTFPSMFDAWWWSIVTMTTVGYGDLYPKSVVGRVLGGLCALYGVLMFSMTVPIFVNTFHSMYQYAVFADMNSRIDKRKEKSSSISISGLIENEKETA